MKKILAGVLSLFAFIAATAGETSIEIKFNSEATDGSHLAKATLLIIFIVIILILVMRTFRGKSNI